jgi:hypothetical protein
MLDRDGVLRVLERIDANLDDDVRLCLIGSGATILLGQPARGTEDLDVWARASRFREEALRRAVRSAGLDYDPRGEFPNTPYFRVVHPGIVQVPGYDPATGRWMGQDEEVVWRGERLVVTVPPPEVIVASKLVRGDDRDLEDCLWLMAARGVDAVAVARAVRGLPRPARDKAKANLDILNLLKGPRPGSAGRKRAVRLAGEPATTSRPRGHPFVLRWPPSTQVPP